MPATPGPLLGPSVAELLASHASGSGSPTKTAARVADAIAARGEDGVWLHTVPRDELVAAAEAIERRPGARTLPLYGVPFGVKDSIDVAGVPTTLACPGYSYVATETAPVVQRLLDAGALFVGKTALDQFATGLNGTRTPHPIPRSVYGADLISGGSSSGSALAVALGQVPFAVATDTAGSGRVPAAMNGIVGFKPSRGLISTVGLVPACRSLDCISLMAGSVDDVDRVFEVVAGRDDGDAWSRDRGSRHQGGSTLRIGLPPEAELEFFGDDATRTAHLALRGRLAQHGATLDVSLAPFLAAGSLLYQGPWVAERLVEFDGFLTEQPEEIHPVVRAIFESGRRYTAVDAFAALQRLQELKAEVDRLWESMDVLVVPTVGTTFTVAEVLADPVDTNTALGHYTHFGNLLDLVAVAVPIGATADGRPASVLLLGAAQTDDAVLELAARLLDEPRDRPVDSPVDSPVHAYRGAPVSQTIEVPAEPSSFPLVEGRTALVIIDMQRDFLLPGGFGETLGNDVGQLQRVVPPLVELLAAARAAGMLVVHTREGHLPDLSDCPPAKLNRGAPSKRIGDPGAFGRILIQGEYGHDIVDELAPAAGEVVIDKPGKGAFYATDLQEILSDAGVTQLIVTGVTTEVCVHTTTREANDRGYECLVVSDCVGSYFPEFQRVGLDMVKAQGGIFGWVADSRAVIGALTALTPSSSPA